MSLFANHQLIHTKDGYIVILYVNKRPSEFAEDFDSLHAEKQRAVENGVQSQIKDYIKENFPSIKVKTVNIMLGSLLIASLSYSNIHSRAIAHGTTRQAQSIVSYQNHRVKYGDTLYTIAQDYGITVSHLKSLNGLTHSIIYPGQVLKIPKQRPNPYIVSYGDTLAKIASLYHVSVEALKMTNDLTSHIIYPGDAIYIPNEETLYHVNQLPDGVFRYGDQGDEVAKIQGALALLGYDLQGKGIFGPKTEFSIKDFQSHYPSLIKDGIFGPNTKTFLKRALLSDHVILSNPKDLLALVNKDFSLPSIYVPDALIVPNVSFPFEGFHEKKLMRKDAAKSLESLFQKAKEDHIFLYALSGYRSYDRQRAIFTAKVMDRGMEKANQYSAKPGESEHQTGLAMDITSPSVNFGLSLYFGETKEGVWLKEYAPAYGFIIRYPKGKEHITGYQYEPWHIRYVGKEAALYISNHHITLEEYLGLD